MYRSNSHMYKLKYTPNVYKTSRLIGYNLQTYRYTFACVCLTKGKNRNLMYKFRYHEGYEILWYKWCEILRLVFLGKNSCALFIHRCAVKKWSLCLTLRQLNKQVIIEYFWSAINAYCPLSYNFGSH